MDIQKLLMEHIAPGLGVLLANFIYFSPFADTLAVFRTGKPSKLNPMPYPWIYANCLSWLVYGAFTRDYYVFFANIFGHVLGIWYTLTALPHADRRFQNIASIILVSSAFTVFSGALIAFIVLQNNVKVGNLVVGIVCIIILAIFYSSPLSDVANVIKSKDSSSINPILAFSSLFNGCLWTVYGLVKGDAFIWGPNILGIGLTIVQIVLIFAFRKPKGTLPQTDPKIVVRQPDSTTF